MLTLSALSFVGADHLLHHAATDLPGLFAGEFSLAGSEAQLTRGFHFILVHGGLGGVLRGQ